MKIIKRGLHLVCFALVPGYITAALVVYTYSKFKGKQINFFGEVKEIKEKVVCKIEDKVEEKLDKNH